MTPQNQTLYTQSYPILECGMDMIRSELEAEARETFRNELLSHGLIPVGQTTVVIDAEKRIVTTEAFAATPNIQPRKKARKWEPATILMS